MRPLVDKPYIIQMLNRLECFMVSGKDNSFKPRLGRIGNVGKSSGKRYVKRVLNAIGKRKSNFPRSKSKYGFTGRNIGRGYYASTFKEKSSTTRFRQRRVVIKARFVKMAGSGFRKAQAHLRYLQRDGVSKDGEDGKLYNAELDDVDGKEFLNEAKDDRHQFRFIVSPEDATELVELKTYTRDLMQQMEKDLGTKLDWVAVDHHNTDHPHIHIIVRGTDDKGKDLIIARDYMSSGFRDRAADLMTDELGPRQDHKIAMALRKEVSQNRFTTLDRKLVEISDAGLVNMRDIPESGYAKFNHTLRIGRLKKLSEMGLAKQYEPGVWQLSADIEPKLRKLGIRGDIIKTMHAEMKRQGRNPLESDFGIFRSQNDPQKSITGKLISKGFSDESNDKYYLVIEGVDGKTHYADIKQSEHIEDYKTGSIVELRQQESGLLKSDHTIANVAANNDGLYSAEIHAQDDPKPSSEYIQAHIRRLESLRRANIVRRYNDGSWEIPEDYLDAALAHNGQRALKSPMNIVTKSQFSLDVQINSSGATWLDRNLVGAEKNSMSNIGFGGEVEAALKRRKAYLIAQGFAKETDRGIAYQRGMLNRLEQQEVQKAAIKISGEIGKQYVPSNKGDHVEGIYTKSVELASGRFAIVEQSKEFNLVPWRSVLERSRNQSVSGKVGGSGISWHVSKRRGIEV